MNSTLLLSPSPKPTIFFSKKNFPTIFRTILLESYSSCCCSSVGRIVIAKCSNSNSSEQKENENGGSSKVALSGMVGDRVEELLKREENKGLLDDLERASLRVELARKELAEIEKQEIEAKQMKIYMNQLQARASEIAECQREILEARAMVEEAEWSLSLGVDGPRNDLMERKPEETEVDKDEERLESIKAALISALIGTIAELPISFTQVTKTSELLLPLAITFFSCALFGVTFRYAVRRDLDNFQLKTGTAAAFGFVKGLAELGEGPPLELDAGSFTSHAFDGAVHVSGSILIFAFAAVSLDFCFKMRLLSPFPIKRSASRTNST